jgi:hypothetical protein
MSPTILKQQAALFTISDAEIINYSRDGAHTGDMYYRGENPEFGAAIDYYLKDSVAKDAISLKIFDSQGTLVDEVKPAQKAGLHRVMWELRYQNEQGGTGRSRINGPYVLPGLYTAKLQVNGETFEQKFSVSDDPRLDVSLDIRKEWTVSQMNVLALASEVSTDRAGIEKLDQQLDQLEKDKISYDKSAAAPLKEISKKYSELFSRIRTLYSEIGDYIGPWTNDQKAQYNYYLSMKDKLEVERDQVLKNTIPQINKGLKKDKRLIIN